MREYKLLINEFKEKVTEWNRLHGEEIMRQCVQLEDNYKPERGVVYNEDLDNIVPSDVKYILVGDNPGQKEQSENRYLIGPAGNQARNFFNNKLGVNFAKNVLVLNKTPIHTKKTDQLKRIQNVLPDGAFDAMQTYMGKLTVQLMQQLDCPLWVIGKSELLELFKPFSDSVKKATKDMPDQSNRILVFSHFSNGRFRSELNSKLAEKCTRVEIFKALTAIGKANTLKTILTQ